jgi:hypothetical protein
VDLRSRSCLRMMASELPAWSEASAFKLSNFEAQLGRGLRYLYIQIGSSRFLVVQV